MQVLLPPDACVVFDLDDTLYKERTYLRSAYAAITESFLSTKNAKVAAETMFSWWLNSEVNVFERAIEEFQISSTVPEMLEIYRSHSPLISVAPETLNLLQTLKTSNVSLACVTDGRSTSQRAKLHSLGLISFFETVVISEEIGSEKPDPRNFTAVSDKISAARYFYIGDNPSKDFAAPNKLGWVTICLRDKGENIHPQEFSHPCEFLPEFVIPELSTEYFYLV